MMSIERAVRQVNSAASVTNSRFDNGNGEPVEAGRGRDGGSGDCCDVGNVVTFGGPELVWEPAGKGNCCGEPFISTPGGFAGKHVVVPR